tara:strand:- start:578 stop:691 length:114 start_codon:yes stop_codon:yes gene_type:complete
LPVVVAIVTAASPVVISSAAELDEAGAWLTNFDDELS